MRKIKEIGKSAKIVDFLEFFQDNGMFKKGLIFKVLSLEAKKYEKEEDKYIIQTKNVSLRNNNTGGNILVNDFYFITFNKEGGKFCLIEIWEE